MQSPASGMEKPCATVQAGGHLVGKGLAVPVNNKLHSEPLHQIKTNTLG